MTSNEQNRVYRMLDDAASVGAQCPTNMDICRVMNFRSVATATRHIKALEQEGLIRVQRNNMYRSVHIVATGRETAPIDTSKYIPKPRAKKARQMSQDDIARLVRHDDSCFKCGTARGCNCGVAL